jgi:DNA-directed RNA polymerase I, II, and III subunit RPABC1
MEKVYQVCIEMFEQRGYNIIDKDDEQLLALKKDGKQVCAFISNTPKFNVEKIQEYITIMKQLDVFHSIIVYKYNATPVAKKIKEDSTEILIELFQEDELRFNITKHYLVPKHELEYEKGSKGAKEFKQKYSNKFPVLLQNDPVCRFYGFKNGDIIKVTRKGGNVIYRIVK